MRKKEDIPVLFPLGTLTQNGVSTIFTDPQGSYTGVPEDVLDQPIQDADDL